MLRKLLILLFICIFFTGCIEPGSGSQQPQSPGGSIGENPDYEPAPDDSSAPAQEPSDPLAGLVPYDASTYVDHTGMSSPVTPEVADYAMCGALADYDVREERNLYVKIKTGLYFQIEGSGMNYAFSMRMQNGSVDPYWNNHNCESGSMNINAIHDSGQCRIIIKNWCSNYYGNWENYMDFEVRWYHQPSEIGNSGEYTTLRQMK